MTGDGFLRPLEGSGESGGVKHALMDHPDYAVLYPLGGGGMGRLYLAWEERSKRLVVLKVPARQHALDPELLAMFEREAHIAAQVKHPNLLGAYRLFDSAEGPVLSMEYIDGVSYHAVLDRVGYDRLGFERQLQLTIEVLSGLDYLHRLTDYEGQWLRLVHRDISPDNVMIQRDGRVTIIDFGIAKGRRLAELTRAGAVTRVPGTIKGKPAYMSPEQARGEIAVDGRSDLYSVGVMLWEAAARRRRWSHIENEDAVLGLVARSPRAEPPGAERFGLPPAVDRICVKALAPDPDERFQSAAEFRAELKALARELGSDERETLAELIEGEFAGLFQERQATIRAERARSDARRSGAHDGAGEATREPTQVRTPSSRRPAPPSLPRVVWLPPAVVLVALAGFGASQLWQSVRSDEAAAPVAGSLPDPAGGGGAHDGVSVAPRTTEPDPGGADTVASLPLEPAPSVGGAVTSQPSEPEPGASGAVTPPAEPRPPETAISTPSPRERVDGRAAADPPRERPRTAPRSVAARSASVASGAARGSAERASAERAGADASRAPSRSPAAPSAAKTEPATTADGARAAAPPASPPQPDERASAPAGDPSPDRGPSQSETRAPADDEFEQDRLHYDP